MAQSLSNEQINAIASEYEDVYVCITGKHVEIGNEKYTSEASYTCLNANNITDISLRNACAKAAASVNVTEAYLKEADSTLDTYVNAIAAANSDANAEEIKAAFLTLGAQLNDNLEYTCTIKGAKRNFDVEELLNIAFTMSHAKRVINA